MLQKLPWLDKGLRCHRADFECLGHSILSTLMEGWVLGRHRSGPSLDVRRYSGKHTLVTQVYIGVESEPMHHCQFCKS
jgi:hypothetical protein